MGDKALRTLMTGFAHAGSGHPVLYVDMEHPDGTRVDRSWGSGKTVATIDPATLAQSGAPARAPHPTAASGDAAGAVTTGMRLADAACMALLHTSTTSFAPGLTVPTPTTDRSL